MKNTTYLAKNHTEH